MKRFYLLLLALLTTGLLFSTQNASACVDPDTSVIIIVNYDTIDTVPCARAGEMEIRLSNLRLMTEDPNKICACALSSFSDLFTNLQYVAFVDSGTNNPYPGFTSFEEEALSSNSWDNSQPGFGGWNGFIADVLNSGLSASDPVELVIRAAAPPGTLVPIDSNCFDNYIEDKLDQSSFGTDEWDPQTLSLKNDHQSVRSLNVSSQPGSSATYTMRTSAYFTQLDDDILSNITPQSVVFLYRENNITVFPNPVKDQLNIEFDDYTEGEVIITLFDITGKELSKLPVENLNAGKQIITYDASSYLKENGIYFLKVQAGDKVSLEKIIYTK